MLVSCSRPAAAPRGGSAPLVFTFLLSDAPPPLLAAARVPPSLLPARDLPPPPAPEVEAGVAPEMWFGAQPRRAMCAGAVGPPRARHRGAGAASKQKLAEKLTEKLELEMILEKL